MSATIQIGRYQATVDHGHWTSKAEPIAGCLNMLARLRGVSGADPNPDLHAAMEAAERFHGEIVSYDPTEYVAGRVY